MASPKPARTASPWGAAPRPRLPQLRPRLPQLRPGRSTLLAKPAPRLSRAGEVAFRPTRHRGVCAPAVAAAAAAPGAPAAAQQARRGPLDRQYILGLCWQQRRHLAAASLCLVLCVAGNLATPVLSGALFETLVQGQPAEK